MDDVREENAFIQGDIVIIMLSIKFTDDMQE